MQLTGRRGWLTCSFALLAASRASSPTTTHSVRADVPPANALAMFATARGAGAYPVARQDAAPRPYYQSATLVTPAPPLYSIDGELTPRRACMTTQTEILRTEGLWKVYGEITAVADMTISVFKGEVFSFLGPNGAGKTTTVGMILGLVRPTRGRALVFGTDIATHPWPVLKRIGAVIETPAFYPYLSGYDNLRALAITLGDIPKGRIEEMLELVGLRERGRDAYKTYSLGMKQRLGIASTLLRDPDLIILDEPTNGLDPAGTREVRELIPRLAREGHGVFLCSHLLHEVQAVSDRIAIIKKGRLIEETSVNELLGRGEFLRLRADDNEALARALGAIPWISGVERVDGAIRAAAPVVRSSELTRALAGQGIYLSEITPWETELESVFLELTGEGAA